MILSFISVFVCVIVLLAILLYFRCALFSRASWTERGAKGRFRSVALPPQTTRPPHTPPSRENQHEADQSRVKATYTPTTPLSFPPFQSLLSLPSVWRSTCSPQHHQAVDRQMERDTAVARAQTGSRQTTSVESSAGQQTYEATHSRRESSSHCCALSDSARGGAGRNGAAGVIKNNQTIWKGRVRSEIERNREKDRGRV
jgi:hypothetical protein